MWTRQPARTVSNIFWIAVFCGLIGAPAAASSGPVVVFTVDVESNGAFRLPDQIDPVCADGSRCGLMTIVRMLEERKWPATFFLNVYEHREWGEGRMRELTLKLQNAGQDLALHTHPQHAYDHTRPGMREYSLEEQTAIVRDGVQLLQSWTGLPVVAHRAGAYAADERTLQALERNGVLVDSSVFWQHPNSRLDGLGLPRNLPGRYGQVLQIPVTVYLREDRPKLVGSIVDPVSVVRKIDADWFSSEAEMRSAIDASIAADFPVLVVFLHSFSFMKTGADGKPVPNRHSIEMFKAMLDHLGQRNLPVVTMRDLAVRDFPLPSPGKDVVPSVTVRVDPFRYAWRRMKHTDDASSMGLGGGIALVCAGAVLVVARQRRATGRRRRTQALPGEMPSR